MGEEKEKIVFKIKKLLAIADGKANLSESLAAAEIAQRLILLHNIHEADLDGPENSRASSNEVFDYLQMHGQAFTGFRNPPEHIQLLLKLIAEANSCEIYLFDYGQNVLAFSIIGQNFNIEFVEFLFSWILAQALKHFGSSGANNFKDFVFGLCFKLKERFSEIKKEIQEESLNKFSLAKIDETKNKIQKILESMHGEESDKKIEILENDSFRKGLIFGDKIMINPKKQLETKQVNLIEE